MLNFHPLENASSTATLYAPKLIELFQPKSILDLGCNIGCWLEAMGVDDAIGVDGDNMRGSLRFPEGKFVAHDLTTPLDLNRKFDLVICIEVAEHLPNAATSTLLQTINKHTNKVFWSAAVPGQGGWEHINEQPHSYWVDLFKDMGFTSMKLDKVLPIAPHDYYRKNAYAFFRE